MCQKSCKVFKQFYALVLTGPVSQTKALQVFKHPPTQSQIDIVVSKHVVGKVTPVPHLYSEKPKIEVVPIEIPMDILYN